MKNNEKTIVKNPW